MAGIMASAVLAGCTNEPAPSSTSQAEAGKDSAAGSGAPAASGDQITLRFMWWGGDERNEATLAVIDHICEEEDEQLGDHRVFDVNLRCGLSDIRHLLCRNRNYLFL